MAERKPTAREQFLDELGSLEEEIDGLTEDLRDDFDNLVTQHSRGEELVDLNGFDKAAKTLLLAFIIEASDLTIDSNVNVAKIGALNEYDRITKELKRTDLTSGQRTQLLKNFRNQILNYPNEVRKRITTRRPFGDNRSMPYRFKTVYDSAQKTVRNILDLGIKNRKSSLDIAKDIRQYIKPTPAQQGLLHPRDLHRERFGLDPESGVSVRGGSVNYNAMRIARTETQRTYRHVPEEINKGKPWVYGFQWNLSRAHPHEDICDDLAVADEDGLGAGIYKDVPDSHPNCICTVTTVLKGEDELLALFED